MNGDMYHLEHAAYWATKAHTAYEEGKYEASNTAAHISEAYSRIASVITNRAAAAANTQSVDDVNAQVTSEIDHAVNGTDHTDPARTIIQELKSTFLRWRSEYASMSRDKTNTEELMSTCDRLANMASHAAFLAELALRDLDNPDLKSP